MHKNKHRVLSVDMTNNHKNNLEKATHTHTHFQRAIAAEHVDALG